MFGDASIPSQGAELLVHVGRNDFNRHGISSSDIFFTYYVNGVRLEPDRVMMSADAALELSLALSVDLDYRAVFQLNDSCALSIQVTPEVCGRLALMAWGDGSEFDLEVRDLSIGTTPPLGSTAGLD